MTRQFRVLFDAGSLGAWGDAALLARFASGRDEAAEAAFAVLVGRHGPMVLRACRAALGDEHEAHDAFQAVFLILARKARTVRVGETLAPWLLGVAWRVSSRSRAATMRRRRHERRAAEMATRVVEPAPVDDAASALMEEVRRLPATARAVVVLCHLEGFTIDGAAARLGIPVGTARSRLSRARDRLRGRLIRRGLAPTVVVASASATVVPAALASSTIGLAVGLARLGTVPAGVALLMKGGKLAMGIKGLALTGSTLALVVGVGGLAAQGTGDGGRSGPKSEVKVKEAVKTAVKASPAAVPGREPAGAKSDFERLQGRWQIVRASVDGNALPPDTPAMPIVRVYRGSEVFYEAADGVKAGLANFRVVDDVRPKGIIVSPANGSRSPPIWSTYEFDGDDRLTTRSALESAGGHGFPKRTYLDVTELVRLPDVPPSTLAQPTSRPADAGPTDERRLQGRWTILKVTENGRDSDDRASAVLGSFTFRGNEFEVRARGKEEEVDRFTFRIDPDAEPRAMLVVAPDSPGERPQWWLYAFERNKLRMAMGQSKAESKSRRPKSFEDFDEKVPLTVIEMIRDSDAPAESVAVPAPRAARFETPGPTTDLEPLPPPSPTRREPSPILPNPPPAATPQPSPLEPQPSPEIDNDPTTLDPPPNPVIDNIPPRGTARPADDLAKLQGTWTVIALEGGGEGGAKQPDRNEQTFIFAGNAMIIKGPGEDFGVFTFTLDAGHEPKTIDFIDQDKARQSRPIPGIYRVEGSVLLVCFGGTAGRPTDFDGRAGQPLYILRRKKSTPSTPAAPANAPAAPARASE